MHKPIKENANLFSFLSLNYAPIAANAENFLSVINPTRIQTGKSFLYSDFTNRPDQKSNGLNPDDSANLDTTKKVFALISLNRPTILKGG
jgi:hypothetical protein